MRGRQSIKKGIWHIGGKYKRSKKRQKGGAIPFGLLAGLAGPILGEIAKPIFGKILGKGLKKKKTKKKNILLIKWFKNT